MQILARCIYRKAVTPSCDIVEMDDATWREFLYAKADIRLKKVLQLLGKESMEDTIMELAWVPLDEHIKITIDAYNYSRQFT